MRLDYVVEIEEYEKAAIIKRWIDELMVFYGIELSKIIKLKPKVFLMKTLLKVCFSVPLLLYLFCILIIRII